MSLHMTFKCHFEDTIDTLAGLQAQQLCDVFLQRLIILLSP